MKNNISNWKEFKIEELFEKKNIEKHPKIPETKGKIPFISSTSMNNGVATFCDEKSIPGNCITVSTNGACFDVFYHKSPIAISSDVEVLYNNNLNKYNAMFICTILKMEKFKWAYGRKPKNDKVFKTKIKLPIIQHINLMGETCATIDPSKKYSKKGYIPDFKYMEKYIKSLNSKTPTTTNKKSNNNIKPNTNSWKEFTIEELFEKRNIEKHPKIPETDGKTPFISSTSTNNGVVMFCNENSIPGNCITVSTNGACFDVFYHGHPIAISSDVEVLYNDDLNKHNAMFICTILKMEKFKWAYGRKPKNDKVFKTKIKLPIIQHINLMGETCATIDPSKKYSKKGYIPDFKYMDEYIQKLPYGDKI